MSLAASHKKLARTLVDKGLGVPAVFLLENMKPFSVVAQQTLFATTPLAIFGGFQTLHKDAVGLFESRETMEEMLLEVERLMEAGDE
jgi:hypothetical protein